MFVRLVLVMFLGMCAYAATPADEYRVKGAFLLNFAKFTTWPDETFKSPNEPIGICIVGKSPFGPEFEQAAQHTIADDRNLSVKEISNASQITQACQIVFVGSSECRHLHTLLQATQAGSILTVGECEGFTDGGGVIAFKLDGERVRIEISVAAATHAKLHISAKLLSLAQEGKK